MLPVLVLAQLAGTAPWFAVNAVMPDLQQAFGWPAAAVGTLTSGVQLGFIAGTLVFALLAVADRYSARAFFLASCLGAAIATLAATATAGSFEALLFWRAVTGVCLAGIYPVGMKIAALWFARGLGAALGLLIGGFWAAPCRMRCGPSAQPGHGRPCSTPWRSPRPWRVRCCG